MMNKKIIYLIDAILLVGTLFAIIGIFTYGGNEITGLIVGPILEKPEQGLVTTQPILFAFENADTLQIDDNLEFTSPKTINVEEEIEIELEPGTYYWKVIGIRESEVRQFSVESKIELKVRKIEEGYEVVNAGNTKLNVEIYQNGKFSEKIILDKTETKISEGDKFVGGINE